MYMHFRKIYKLIVPFETMGLRRFLIKRAAKKKLQAGENDKLNLIADAYLELATKKHARTLKQAEKINKAKLLYLQENQLRDELKQGLDDEEDFDEEDDEEEDTGIENVITDVLVKRFFGVPATPNGENNTETKNGLLEIAKNLSSEDIEKLKNKFLN